MYTVSFLSSGVVHFLPAAFFGLLVFLAGAALRAFFAGAAEVLVEAVEEGAAAVAAAAVADGLAAGALLLDLEAAGAAFFFGDAAFFFGLLALVDLGLAAALGFGFEPVAERQIWQCREIIFVHSFTDLLWLSWQRVRHASWWLLM